MVRIGSGQSGSGSTDDDSGDAGTSSRQTGRRGAVEQDDPEDVADGGDDGGTGTDTGGRQTGRSGAVEQDDPADVVDGGGDGGMDTDTGGRQTGRAGAVEQDRPSDVAGDTGGGAAVGGAVGGIAGPGGSRNVEQIQDREPDVRQPYEPQFAPSRDRQTIRDVQEFSQRRAAARAEAFDERQRELATEDFRDVQEFAQRRAEARAEAFDERQRELATEDFRDVQEMAQRRATQRKERIEGIEAQIAEQTGQAEATVEFGEDFTIEDGQVQLTAEGRREATEAELIERGEIRVDRQGATVPVIEWEIGGGEETVQITQPDQQLQFDEEGNLVGVADPEYTAADIEAAEGEVYEAAEENIPVVGGVVGFGAAKTAGYTRKGLGVGADVSTDVGAGIQDIVIDPVSEASGDIQSAYAESIDVVNPLSDEFLTEAGAEEALTASGDIARGEEAEQSEETFIEGATTKLGAGALSPIRFGAELPATAQTGVQTLGEGAEFTAGAIDEQGIGGGLLESGEAAGGAAVGVGETVAVQTINNPIMTTGTLIGSAGIMGGAAAVSGRAGLATRAAIQPGEEILGYGGFAATRRVAGTGTAQRLFPNQEPLIFSEEAAIRTGRRIGGGLRNVGGRVARGAASPGRLGVGLGGFKFETETGSDADTLITGEELDVRRDPVRPAEERTEIETGSRIAQQRQARLEREAGERDVQETFDPDRPQTMMERRAARRQAERDDPTAEAQQRLEEAQEPFSIDDPLIGTRRRFETALDQEQIPVEESQLLQQPLTDLRVAQEPTVGMDTRLDTDIRLGTELDQETGVDVRTELETDQEVRLDTETETEARQDLRVGLETETETETETELEQELEQELEVEAEQRDREDMRRRDRDVSSDPFLEEFEYGVADPLEVLTGDGT